MGGFNMMISGIVEVFIIFGTLYLSTVVTSKILNSRK